jgi:Holliday junction DNA helicase RuvA
MIALIEGEVVTVREKEVVVSCAGVGYRVFINTRTGSGIKGSRTRLHTAMVVREDAQELFGFLTEGEREMFRRLIRISGIGPRAALALLELEPERLLRAVAAEDVKTLSAIQGIGPKTARRIVSELKEAAEELGGFAPVEDGSGEGDMFGDALSALEGLGFNRSEAHRLLEKALKSAPEPASVEGLIKLALKRKG